MSISIKELCNSFGKIDSGNKCKYNSDNDGVFK